MCVCVCVCACVRVLMMDNKIILFLFPSSVDSGCCNGEFFVQVVIERVDHLQLLFSVDLLQLATAKLTLS